MIGIWENERLKGNPKLSEEYWVKEREKAFFLQIEEEVKSRKENNGPTP